jgi:hypothetical protein
LISQQSPARIEFSLQRHDLPIEPRCFTSPHQDLYLDEAEEKSVSPLDWLKTGGDPTTVAELTSEI